MGNFQLSKELLDAIHKRSNPQWTDIAIPLVSGALAAAAYHSWVNYKKNKCVGLSGKELRACKIKAINEAIQKVKQTIPKCKNAKNPKKCIQDAKKIIAEWEAKKRTL